jgi:hypothetical protein
MPAQSRTSGASRALNNELCRSLRATDGDIEHLHDFPAIKCQLVDGFIVARQWAIELRGVRSRVALVCEQTCGTEANIGLASVRTGGERKDGEAKQFRAHKFDLCGGQTQ